jgi:hypothetical protein
MATASHIHVRPLELGDFDFVRNLASRQPNFTVPPVYVLWLLIRIRGSICLVAEHSAEGVLAYLLSVPVEGPGNSVFIWQVAASEGRQRNKAMLATLTRFREIVFALSVEKVFFSTVLNSPIYRLIRRYAWQLASLVPEELNPLPSVVNSNESEFWLDLKQTDAKAS